jgi:hypothetical protein
MERLADQPVFRETGAESNHIRLYAALKHQHILLTIDFKFTCEFPSSTNER